MVSCAWETREGRQKGKGVPLPLPLPSPLPVIFIKLGGSCCSAALQIKWTSWALDKRICYILLINNTKKFNASVLPIPTQVGIIDDNMD